MTKPKERYLEPVRIEPAGCQDGLWESARWTLRSMSDWQHDARVGEVWLCRSGQLVSKLKRSTDGERPGSPLLFRCQHKVSAIWHAPCTAASVHCRVRQETKQLRCRQHNAPAQLSSGRALLTTNLHSSSVFYFYFFPFLSTQAPFSVPALCAHRAYPVVYVCAPTPSCATPSSWTPFPHPSE